MSMYSLSLLVRSSGAMLLLLCYYYYVLATDPITCAAVTSHIPNLGIYRTFSQAIANLWNLCGKHHAVFFLLPPSFFLNQPGCQLNQLRSRFRLLLKASSQLSISPSLLHRLSRTNHHQCLQEPNQHIRSRVVQQLAMTEWNI